MKSSTKTTEITAPHQLAKEGAGYKCEQCGQTWVHEPVSTCPSVPVYKWGEWPDTLLTLKQLKTQGYDVKNLPPPVGCSPFDARTRWLWLYASWAVERPHAKLKLIQWHPYPAVEPAETMGGEHGYTLLNNDGTITLHCFYRREDAAHDHSVWQKALGWLERDEITTLLASIPIEKVETNEERETE